MSQHMPVIHELKTWPIPFDAVKSGRKRFEVRKNDRFFQTGDTVRLRRFNPDHSYKLDDEPVLLFQIGWMLQGGQFGIEPGYVVFGLEPLEEERRP